MTPPPAAATVAGRRAPRDADSEYIVTRAPRRASTAVREPQARSQTRERPRPATRPSSRASAAAAALEATLAPPPAPARREQPAPSRTRREGPAPARPRREAPSRSRAQAPRSVRTRVDHGPRPALRLQPPRLDRIVRGRAWIPVLGAMLVAIVGLRVAVLKLGASVGTQIQQATLLESSNSILRTRISALADNRRIEKLAQAYGMHLPNPLDVHFVQSSAGRSVQAAINNISAPANSTFLGGLATEQHNDAQSTQYTASLSAAAGGGGGGASVVASGSSSTTSTAGTGTGVASSTAGQTTAGQTTAGQTTSSAATTASTAGTATTSTASSSNSSAATASAGGGTAALNTGQTDTAAGAPQSLAGSTAAGSGGTGLAG